MKTIKTLCIIVIALVLGLFVVFNVLMTRIEVGQVGVRVKQYALFGSKGVEDKDFQPGWHRSIPMLDVWNLFDATVQTTEFTTPEQRRQEQMRIRSIFAARGASPSNAPVTGPELIELKSKDGYTVKLDVTVKYRIMPESAHMLYEQFNTEVRYKGIVRDQVQQTLRNTFGTMTTEEFYHPEARRVQTVSATATLTKNLVARHVELISILIRDISFDKSYERKILDKKLADQEVELNKSKAELEEKRGETNIIMAETEAKVKVIDEELVAELLTMKAETDKEIAQIRADAKLEVAQIQADADLYAAETVAKGTLLEKEADAEGERLKAAALQGSGGANYVALEAAKGLQLEEMRVSTLDNDFLDVENVVSKLGAEK